MDASCQACKARQSLKEFCVANPKTSGCPDEPKKCCRAMNAKCLACTQDMSVKDFCRANPKTAGCEEDGPHGAKCKNDKACAKKSDNPCDQWQCDDGQCVLAATSSCSVPTCNGRPRVAIPGTCCEFYPCPWDGDVCNYTDGNADKKACKALGKAADAKCKFNKKAKRCWTSTVEGCTGLEGKACKQAGCRLNSRDECVA
jgi:hypothetical protein